MTLARMLTVGLALLALELGAPRAARADGPIGANGAPITTSSYSIDGARGSVLSSSRVTGLSGAFSAIAEGVEGGLTNPASIAVRFAGSVETWDYWLAAGVTYPADNGDYFNSGGYLDTDGAGKTSFYFVNPGVYFQIYGFGIGFNIEVQGLTVTNEASGATPESELTLELTTQHFQLGYRFLDGQLVIGGGVQVLHEEIAAGPTGMPLESLHDQTGVGGEVGFLIRPNDAQWRLGGGLYSTVRTEGRRERGGGDVIVGSFYLPRYTVMPWRASLAFAYQLGDRPFNPRWTYVQEVAAEPLAAVEARREAAIEPLEARLEALRSTDTDASEEIEAIEQQVEDLEAMFDAEEDAVEKQTWRALRRRVRSEWPRHYALLTAQLDVTSRVHSGVGFESFLAQTVQRSGERVTVTPRVGVEAEVWPTWMKLRAGLYVEPTRFAQSDPRVHGTFGFDLRTVRWDVFGLWPEDYLWQISAAIDGTPGYIAFSVSLGGWY